MAAVTSMACRSAVTLSSVSRPSSALRAAAPRASRTGRRSVNVQSAVELDYDVKVFDKELVSPATHRMHPAICHASNEHPQSSGRSRQHTCMRLSLSPCPQHIFALLLRFAASSWAADPAAGRCESPAAARAASRNVSRCRCQISILSYLCRCLSRRRRSTSSGEHQGCIDTSCSRGLLPSLWCVRKP